ncbi:MAG: COX15/CtaA family protein [Acidimicrobiia bacterium]|nr:COX15/CtaA family protein [Acidimicrobiia bacterium]
MNRFTRTAWAAVGLTVFVILWGAVVRATGSGAGCGNDWPTCNGGALPLTGSSDTIIELVHRLTSAALGLVIVYLLILAVRSFPSRHRVRLAAWATLGLVVVESLIGAGLVLFEQTGDFEGVSRAYWQAGHFTNTMLLLAAVTLTAWWASASYSTEARSTTRREKWMIVGVGAAMLAVGVSGAIAALGDTLFPVDSFLEGLERELSAAGHLFERLRVWHPVIAVGAGFSALWVSNRLAENRGERISRMARTVTVIVFGQLALGVVNVLLAAPVWMQLVHLLVADVLWMSLVVLAADVFTVARDKVSA